MNVDSDSVDNADGRYTKVPMEDNFKQLVALKSNPETIILQLYRDMKMGGDGL